MLVNTLKAKKRLVEEFHFSDEHAESIVEVVSPAKSRARRRKTSMRCGKKYRR